ncbi:uncharacterized protein LOC122004546 [Zingiber officinale]|uniref:uncharacterized protein LOC122004546 n=1 Tax=Zingiber officinale TaxID=94328 RepID=UPI001C4D29C3|nr:uncharacterized protein LOC122004546 [Zingiber officinale]
MQLAVRLDYRATNIEVEYEALIASLQAAWHIRAVKVLIHSDSQLAAQQLSGAFEISNVRLKPYAEVFEKLKSNFQEVVIQKIPRSKNQAANELVTLASLLTLIVIVYTPTRTTPKEGTGLTPFHLVYDDEAVIPVEVKLESDRVQHYDKGNAERRLLELDLVNEARTKAAIRPMTYRQRMKQTYNRRVIPRSFQAGDLVWKKVKPVRNATKLEAPWARPFKVVENLRSDAYYLEDETGRRLKRPWSANHLQPYRAG